MVARRWGGGTWQDRRCLVITGKPDFWGSLSEAPRVSCFWRLFRIHTQLIQDERKYWVKPSQTWSLGERFLLDKLEKYRYCALAKATSFIWLRGQEQPQRQKEGNPSCVKSTLSSLPTLATAHAHIHHANLQPWPEHRGRSIYNDITLSLSLRGDDWGLSQSKKLLGAVCSQADLRMTPDY